MELRPSALLRIAAPLRSLVQRFMFLGLIALSFCLMLVAKIDAVVIDHVRAEITDIAAPILEGLSRPIATISSSIQNIQELRSIRQENLRLVQENANLKQWVYTARRLHNENKALQNLLHSVSTPKPEFVTARVIAGAMGSFSNSFVINAGSREGIEKGQTVLSDQGFVGRIISVSKKSARILLASDINSRVPVLLESTRTRALKVGSNNNHPELIHLPSGAQITSSERVITSGHGGVFPPGLPVGLVGAVDAKGIEVLLFSKFDRLEFVRVADFGLNGLVELNLGDKVGGKASREP